MGYSIYRVDAKYPTKEVEMFAGHTIAELAIHGYEHPISVSWARMPRKEGFDTLEDAKRWLRQERHQPWHSFVGLTDLEPGVTEARIKVLVDDETRQPVELASVIDLREDGMWLTPMLGDGWGESPRKDDE